MTLKDFEELVAQALDSLPYVFAKALDNADVVVEIWPPPGENLFGLYRGIPQTKRGTMRERCRTKSVSSPARSSQPSATIPMQSASRSAKPCFTRWATTSA